jgi:hypothetical protein
MKRRQVFRAQASKSQTGSSARRFVSSGPVLPFNPASIPGCQLWLDGADSSTIAFNSSSNVLAWIDKSNTGTIATPTRGATANPITYTTIDGYPGVYINNNGSAVYNASTYSQLTVQSNFQPTADYSIFAVVNLSNVSGAEYQTIYANARGTSGETRTPNFGAGMSLEYNSDNTNRMISSSFIGTGRLQTALISSSSALTAYTNATAYASNTNAYTRPSTDVGALPMIGGTFGASADGTSDNRFATGYFHEILVYNSVLTTIQRQKVEGYLAHKWGLQSSLPSNHPHKTAGPTYEEPVFVPTLISGSQLWLDAVDQSSISLSGTTVTQWNDKSGNGRNTSSAIGSSLRVSNVVNNLPGVYFNSTAFRGSFVYSGTQLHCFLVGTIGNSGQYPRVLSIGNQVNDDFSSPLTTIPFCRGGPGVSGIQVNRNNNALIASFPAYNTAFLAVSAQYENTLEISVNGATPTTTSSGTSAAFSTTTYALGIHSKEVAGTGEQTLVGNICELIVFNTYLTTSQRKRVEGYLAQKWGIHSSLPANHPYKTIAPTGIPRSITIQELSALFNNSSISVPANAAVTLGTNNHTIEFWAYQTSRGQYDCPFQYSTNTSAFSTSSYYMALGGYLGILIGNNAGNFAINMGATVSLPSLNAWHHYAIVRNGTIFTIYINGISRETATSSVNIGAQGGSFIFGDVLTTTTTPFFGYITNFRLVNGTAVYTSNFTPPTSPLTAIPNTQILIQGLVDRSPNAFTVTSTGSVTLSTSVSPFV